MKLKALKREPVLVAASIMVLVCAAQIPRFEFFERLERMTYDWRVRQAAKHPSAVATNLAFVHISDTSIQRLNDGSLGFRHYYGTYWPRHIYGRVARELATEGARVTAFDVLFGELHPDDAPVPMAGQLLPVDSDEYFARLIGKAANVVLASEQGLVPPPLFRTNALVLGDITADKDFDGVLRRVKAFRVYRKWHRLFQRIEEDPEYGVDLRKAMIEPRRIILLRSEGEPIVIPLDKEGRFDAEDLIGTNVPPTMERYPQPFTDERVWHMGIVLAAQALGLDLARAEIDLKKGRIVLPGPNGVSRTIPVDADGYFFINWCLTTDDPRLTQAAFEDLLRQDQMRLRSQTNGLENRLRGKLVIIGSSATGNDLTDRGATPLEKDAILVSKHWNVANSIITGRFVQRAGLPVELVLICLLGAIATVLTCTQRVLVASSWVVATMVVYVGLTFMIFSHFGYWLPMVLPVTGGLLITHGCLLAYLVIFEQAQQRFVKALFGKMVSPMVVQELLKSEKLSLTSRRTVTVLFADIRGFTEMTDLNREQAAEYIKQHQLVGEAAEAVFEKQAHETLATVNLYLKTIAEAVLRHNGTVDKFIGDCVMAFWGAPLTDPQHALHCVQAAIDIQRTIYRLNSDREVENRRSEEENLKREAVGEPPLPLLPVLSVGTGINTGAVTVGLMGSEERLNYTVFGRDVNLASRLETVSGRGRIIISESTLAEMIQDDADLALACVELPPEKVKGIREAVRIYEVPWRTEGLAAASEATPSEPEAGHLEDLSPGKSGAELKD